MSRFGTVTVCVVAGAFANSISPPKNSPAWFRQAVFDSLDFYSGPDGEGQDVNVDLLWRLIQARKRKQRRAA